MASYVNVYSTWVLLDKQSKCATIQIVDDESVSSAKETTTTKTRKHSSSYTPTDVMSFSQRMQHARISARMSIATLSEKSMIDASSLAAFERDIEIPPNDIQSRIMNVINAQLEHR